MTTVETEDAEPLAGGGWISGPSIDAPAGDPVAVAIQAIRGFGGTGDRYRAASLLAMWVGRDLLTQAQRRDVLDAFGTR